MVAINKSNILAGLQTSVSADLCAHLLRVGKTARKLAVRFNLNPELAEAGGLLHDISKEKTAAEILALATKYKIQLFSEDYYDPVDSLHARVGEYEAREKFDIELPEILQAIRCHTFGEPNINEIAMVVAIADDIEPARKAEHPKRIAKIEEALSKSLEAGLLKTLQLKLKKESKKYIHPHPLLFESLRALNLKLNPPQKIQIPDEIRLFQTG